MRRPPTWRCTRWPWGWWWPSMPRWAGGCFRRTSVARPETHHRQAGRSTGRNAMLTERFAAAVDYARIAHAGQLRKGTSIPYIQHLLGVASLVLEHGGDEDQAIAGLLHDVLEDCGEAHAATIGDRLGARVLAIVRGCTDGTAEGKAAVTDPDARRRDWVGRKQAY